MKILKILIIISIPLSLLGEVYTVPIDSIQGYQNASPYEGDTVMFYGVVTAPFTYVSSGRTRYAFFVEMKPGGPWKGIYIYNGSSDPNVERGDSVRITGVVSEYNGVTEVSYPEEITVLGHTTPPDPVIDSTGNIEQEKYEGVLVKVVNAVCTRDLNSYNEWDVDDGSGPVTIDDRIYFFDPVVGDTYSVTGPVDYYYGFKILPRDGRDILEPGEIEGLYGDFDPLRVFPDETFDLKIRIISQIDTVKFVNIVLPPVDWSHSATDLVLPSHDSVVVVSDSVSGDTVKIFGVSIIDTVEMEIRNVSIGSTGSYHMEVYGSTNGTVFSLAYDYDLEVIERPSNLVTIADVQQPGEDGFTSHLYGQNVAVVGYATTGNLKTEHTSFYLNDTTGGVDVFTYDAVSIKPNYKYLVVGQVDEYKGLTEVKANEASDIILLSRWNPPFPPETLNLSQSLDESWEGRLVCIKKGKIVSPVSPISTGGGYNLTVANGQAYVTVRLETGTGINVDSIRNIMNVGDIFTITGIVGQYDPHEPFTTGYQVLPRYDTDVVKVIAEDTTSELTCTITPNPFAPDEGQVANIHITAPPDSRITAKIFDIKGRFVKEICTNYPGGPYDTFWNGDNQAYDKVTIGIYLLRVEVTYADGTTRSITKPVVVATKGKR